MCCHLSSQCPVTEETEKGKRALCVLKFTYFQFSLIKLEDVDSFVHGIKEIIF